jgi:hypothetical protein
VRIRYRSATRHSHFVAAGFTSPSLRDAFWVPSGAPPIPVLVPPGLLPVSADEFPTTAPSTHRLVAAPPCAKRSSHTDSRHTDDATPDSRHNDDATPDSRHTDDAT